MKQLKKSANVSVISVISGLVGDGYFSDEDNAKVVNIRTTLNKVYRKWRSLKDGADRGENTKEEFITFENSLDKLSLSYVKYMNAKERYDRFFGNTANNTVRAYDKVCIAIEKISKDSNFTWFSVDYLKRHGYPVTPFEQCTTKQQLVSHISKLYATALTEKQEVAKVAQLVHDYIERATNRLNQLKDWNVAITEEVIKGILDDTLIHETDGDVIKNVTEKVKATFAK